MYERSQCCEVLTCLFPSNAPLYVDVEASRSYKFVITQFIEYRAVAKSFRNRACVPVSSESFQAVIMLKVSHFRQTTCSCAGFIKHSEHIIALEVDVLDSNCVLSTMLKRLLTRRIILYAISLGISCEVGVAVTFT